jgi:hypothetical protein
MGTMKRYQKIEVDTPGILAKKYPFFRDNFFIKYTTKLVDTVDILREDEFFNLGDYLC